MKVYFDGRNSLFLDKFANSESIEVTSSCQDSDIIISEDDVSNLNEINKTIYICKEAPLAPKRRRFYSHFDEFSLVICHDPEKDKSNQIPFTPDNASQFFPYNPAEKLSLTRTDTTLSLRSIFFAGQIKTHETAPDCFNAHNITKLRKIFGDYFIDELPGSTFIGKGWDGQTTKVVNWRVDKQDQITKSGCDFVLALENTIYPNYLTEKIWDGFNSDRVTLYLGDPNIESHIPLNCFIDLRPYYDLSSKSFDLPALKHRLTDMTQGEYDDILNNAREFRRKAIGKHKHYRHLFTDTIINFINSSAVAKQG